MLTNYLERSGLAPYLDTLQLDDGVVDDGAEAISDGAAADSSDGEADAAGGGMLRRVSSFSLLGGSNATRSLGKKVRVAPQEQQQRPESDEISESKVEPTWRLKDRTRTFGVGLVMALNIGSEPPPGVTRPHPCARLQCWIDPRNYSRAKAKEKIAEQLEAQYSNWQQQKPRALKYKRALDPAVEDVRALCLGLRRQAQQAKTERILLHYNGHGVPNPTAQGEIWVFDRSINHRHYVPLPVSDMRQWLGKPSMIVLDCSNAGVLMPYLTTPLEGLGGGPTSSFGASLPPRDMDTTMAETVKDTIVLCPTSQSEWLPMLPEYPADIFTACLTTPIQMALRWFVRRSPHSMGGLSPEVVDEIPGKPNDRKTPLGELNWIFTTVTDSIAWNVLPKPLFSRLFRQDLLVASMFRNFLLADRILRSLNCTPQSFPPLPPGVCDHPLWQAWDLACETCLHGLISDGLLGNHMLGPRSTPEPSDGAAKQSPNTSPKTGPKPSPPEPQQVAAAPPKANVSSPFFSEQLTAFEVWLEFAAIRKDSLLYSRSTDAYDAPEQLPVVLQTLLSQTHRVRALALLRRFLELGDWATNMALSLGVLPYVLKLLQSPEYKQVLVGIWAKILAFDPSCQRDLVEDGALPHFILHLSWGLREAKLNPTKTTSYNDAAEQRTMAAFIISLSCAGYSRAQEVCIEKNLQGTSCALLSSAEFSESGGMEHIFPGGVPISSSKSDFPPLFRLWLCISLGNMVKGNDQAQTEAYVSGVHLCLFARLNDDSPDVRAAVCYALGCLLGSPEGHKSKSDSKDSPQRRPSTPTSRNDFSPGYAPVGGNPMQRHPVPVRFHNTADPSLGPTVVGAIHPNMTGAPVLQWNQQPLREGMVPQLSQVAVPPPQFGTRMVAPHPVATAMPHAGYPYGGQGQPVMLSPQFNRQPSDTRQQPPSVFEDRNRLVLDLTVMESLVQCMDDVSPLVRYEVLMSIARAVERYLEAFCAIAEGTVLHASGNDDEERPVNSEGKTESDDSSNVIKFPSGVDSDLQVKFISVWQAIRSFQHEDLHPVIKASASTIVSVVHESILRRKMELSKVTEDDDRDTPSDSDSPRQGKSAPMVRNQSDARLVLSSEGIVPAASSGHTEHLHGVSGESGRDITTHTGSPSSIRRIASEVMPRLPPGFDVSSSVSSHHHAHSTPGKSSQFKIEYVLPRSSFYEWKRDAFVRSGFTTSMTDDTEKEVDALCMEGALHAYRERRNAQMHSLSDKLAERYAGLVPKPKPPRAFDDELMFEDDAADAAEAEAASRKRELKLKQSALFSTGSENTSILKFHPYEEVLVVGDGADEISVWDIKNSTRAKHFQNGNPKNCRMTSASWINERSSSLFLVGCDDGSVRVWDGLVEADGEISSKRPSLSSAFFAAPDIVGGGSKGSGLITEWQQYSGRLLAAGNSKLIRCWDMNTEKCTATFDTNVDAYISTLTTAWEDTPYGGQLSTEGSAGMGPDIVVAGCSNGCLKMFDLRIRPEAAELNSSSQRSSRRQRLMNYSEHKTWIVSTAFVRVGGRHAVISGSSAGDVKIWDLRMSTSVKTMEVQRDPLTALSAHPRIPLVATGSNAQFIKVVSLDGDTLQRFRFHEKQSGQRIGPVSCLEFHPHTPILASGTTDKTVSIYSPTTNMAELV